MPRFNSVRVTGERFPPVPSLKRRRLRTGSAALGALAIILSLASCGDSKTGSRLSAAPTAGAPTTAGVRTTTTTEATDPSATTGTGQPSKAPSVEVRLRSSVKLRPIPARYTCDGANLAPPLSWSGLPARTAEVDVMILSVSPIKGKYDIAWAVAGLSPKLHHLSPGRIPLGAVIGRNSFGGEKYSLCPPRRKAREYAIILYPLPHKIAVHDGFDAEALVKHSLVHFAESEGELFLSYRRR